MKRVAKRQDSAEKRLLEFSVAATPVVGRHPLNPLAAEGVGEDSGLHRAVDNDAGAMRGAPGNDVRGGLAMNQRERRLKRIDMANTLSPLEQPHVEVRDPAGTHLPLPDQARHLTPRLFHRRAERVRPVKLVQVDALDAEPAKRSLDFFTDRSRPKVALRLFEGPRW